MLALLASVFTASLLGSLHCAAMCGGFVCAVSGEGRPLASQIAWHSGRGAAYLLLGALAGMIGAGLEHTLAPAGLPNAAAVGAGALLIVAGLGALVQAMGLRGTPTPDASPFARVIGSGLRAVRAWPLLARATAMGSLTALLPCGWLWAFVATAAGTGSVVGGLAVMAVFWSGTLPLLAALGFAAGRALGPLRSRLPVVTAIAMIVVGLLTVAGRLQPHRMDHPGHGGHAGHSMHVQPAAHAGDAHVGH